MKIRMLKNVNVEVFETEDNKVPFLEQLKRGQDFEVTILSDEDKDAENITFQLEDGSVMTLDAEDFRVREA